MTKPTIEMIQRAKLVLAATAGDPRYSAAIEALGDFFPDSPDRAWLTSDQIVGTIFTSEADGWLEEPEDTAFWRLVGSVDTSRQVPEDFGRLLTYLGANWQVESGVEQADLYGLFEVAAVAGAMDMCELVRALHVPESAMSEADVVEALTHLTDADPGTDEPAGGEQR